MKERKIYWETSCTWRESCILMAYFLSLSLTHVFFYDIDSSFANCWCEKTSVADFIIESIYDLQGKVNDERVNSPIKNLRKRFDDVSSWTTYIVLSQLLPDERRAAFGCLLRVAISCWNIGNFIGAREIITGLRWIRFVRIYLLPRKKAYAGGRTEGRGFNQPSVVILGALFPSNL